MKTYQLYEIVRFPKLRLGQSDVTHNQLSLWGQNEQVQTRLTMVKPNLAGFEEFRVKSRIPVKVFGIVKFWNSRTNAVEEHDFHEYLRPVEFAAYVHREDNLIMLQAPRPICRGVLENIRKKSETISLAEKKIDFSRVRARVRQYSGAWFRKVSANVNAEGLTGNSVEDDPRFKELVAYAPLSSLTVKFKLDDSDHKIQITRHAAVVLQHQYATLKAELQVLLDFKRRVLDTVWEDKM